LLHLSCIEVNETVSRVSSPITNDSAADTSADALTYSSTAEAVRSHPFFPYCRQTSTSVFLEESIAYSLSMVDCCLWPGQAARTNCLLPDVCRLA